jgi:hypothetical protein
VRTVVGLAIVLVACDPNIVGAPLDSGLFPEDAGDVDAGPNTYPPGPYGISEGDILQNLSFAGYVSQRPEDGVVSGLSYTDPVTLDDLRQLSGYRYLLLNFAAEWCVPCQGEAQVLPGHYAEWAPKGGLVASVLTEDSNTLPATKRDLESWINAYDTTYTMVHDPRGETLRVLAPPTMPLNLIIDLSTMRIVRRTTGDDPDLFPRYGGLLE